MNCFLDVGVCILRLAYSLGICRELGIAIFTHAKHRNIILSFDDPKFAFRHAPSFPIAWDASSVHLLYLGCYRVKAADHPINNPLGHKMGYPETEL
jgi:hypothetical protein